MIEEINLFHEKSMEEMDLPKWANFCCPFCQAELPLRAIRTISLKLNTRNKGDLTVEFCCTGCGIMDTVYFRRQISELTDFIELISDVKSPDCPPVVEEDMYKLKYNNVFEDMLAKKRETK